MDLGSGYDGDGLAYARRKTEDGLNALELILSEIRTPSTYDDTDNTHSTHNVILSNTVSDENDMISDIITDITNISNPSQIRDISEKSNNSNNSHNLQNLQNLQNSDFSIVPNLFAVGTSYPTIADLCIIPQIYNARYRLHIPVNALNYPHLTAIDALCASLSCFAEASPDMQPDAVEILTLP